MIIKTRPGKYETLEGDILSEKTFLGRGFILVGQNDTTYKSKYSVHEKLTGAFVMPSNSKSGWFGELKLFTKNKEETVISILSKFPEVNSASFQQGIDVAKKIFDEYKSDKNFVEGFMFFIEEKTDIFSG